VLNANRTNKKDLEGSSEASGNKLQGKTFQVLRQERGSFTRHYQKEQ
jgi:DNA relaxase NicK